MLQGVVPIYVEASREYGMWAGTWLPMFEGEGEQRRAIWLLLIDI